MIWHLISIRVTHLAFSLLSYKYLLTMYYKKDTLKGNGDTLVSKNIKNSFPFYFLVTTNPQSRAAHT